MSQCVPSWDLDDSPPARLPFRSRSNSIALDVPLLDYEVAELTWENGQIAMHGLGPPRVPNKTLANTTTSTATTTTNSHPCKYWEKPRAGGTLESIVNQATRSSFFPHKPPLSAPAAADELVPWFDHHTAAATAAAAAASTIPACSVDAQVPCSHRPHQTDVASCRPAASSGGGGGASVNVGSYTQVASCSVAATQEKNNAATAARIKRSRVARVPPTPEWSGLPDPSVSGTSASLHHMRMDQYSCERDFGVGFASTSLGSPENASSAKPSTKAVTATATATAAEDHDSVCHSRLHQRESGDEEEEEEEEEEDKKKGNGKSSISTKRSRAAAIHNQSERKRRDKINQRMKTLQKLVPNSSKTDKASMLDEVIDYLKQLQAQVQMMSRMNMPAMMLPVAMQQQLQLSMMSPMGMGIGMGMDMNMNMNMNTMGRPNIPGISPAVLHPNPFMSMASWDGSGPADGRLQPQMAAVIPDPLSQFLFACQSQPMTTEAYSRMASMYQQLHQPPASSSKS